MIEEALYSVLTSSAAITAQLGARPAGDSGVYPVTIPEDPVLPAVSYRIIATVDSPTLDNPTGVTKVRFGLECWGATYADAVKTRSIVTKGLLGYQGTVATSDGDVTIQNILRVTDGDVFADVPRQYTARVDLYVWA